MPVAQLVQSYLKSQPEQENFINFGWRGWEGTFPTSIMGSCSESPNLNEITIAYYNETIKTLAQRLSPLACYFIKIHDQINLVVLCLQEFSHIWETKYLI